MGYFKEQDIIAQENFDHKPLHKDTHSGCDIQDMDDMYDDYEPLLEDFVDSIGGVL